jgi:hypothetical protein
MPAHGGLVGELLTQHRGMYPGRRHMRNPELASADVSRLGELGQLLLTGDGAAREQVREHGTLSDVDFARAASRRRIRSFRAGDSDAARPSPRFRLAAESMQGLETTKHQRTSP